MKKYKSAEAKRMAEQNAVSWENLKKKYEPKSPIVKRVSKVSKYQLSIPPGRTAHRDIPSLGDTTGFAAARQIPVYTGTEMIGITIIHKSCLQPVFSQQAAMDAANMRR